MKYKAQYFAIYFFKAIYELRLDVDMLALFQNVTKKARVIINQRNWKKTKGKKKLL